MSLPEGVETRIATADVFFYRGGCMSVSWSHHVISPVGAVVDRIWLTALYYGSVLTSFRAEPETQSRLQGNVGLTVAQVLMNPAGSHDVRAATGDYTLEDRCGGSREKHYSTTLVMSKNQSFINRDKKSLLGARFYAPLAALALLGSNCGELETDDSIFMAHWFNGMNQFYRQHSMSDFGRSVYATFAGYQFALEQMPSRQGP